MAARKLQSEIDRHLKKIREGVDEFEAVHDKLQKAVNAAQKDKLEVDLKTLIKKLQRMRDQIKTWLQSHEIKDKTVLLEHRRLIETQMETFRHVEREMKTKAFSKQGLNAAGRKDPAEIAKEKTTLWLQTQVDELGHQVEAAEAEIEQLSTKKCKGAWKQARTSSLRAQNSQRHWHISRLELLLRSLENDTLGPEEVDEIKDDVVFYVENNTDQRLESYDYIYDQFNLEEREQAFGLKDAEEGGSSHEETSTVSQEEHHTPHHTPKGKGKHNKDNGDESFNKAVFTTPGVKEKRARRLSKDHKDKDEEMKDVPAASKHALRQPEEDEGTVPPANFSKPLTIPSATAVVTTATTKPATTVSILPPLQYAAAAAQAVSPTTPSQSKFPTFVQEGSAPDASGQGHDGSTPSVDHTRRSSVTSYTASTSASHLDSPDSNHPAPDHVLHTKLVDTASALPVPTSTSPADALLPLTISQPVDTPVSDSLAPTPVSGATATLSTPTHGPPPGLTSSPDLTQPPGLTCSLSNPPTQSFPASTYPTVDQPTTTASSIIPPALASLVDSLHASQQNSVAALESSQADVPFGMDLNAPTAYIPKSTYVTPAYYPQQPLHLFNEPVWYAQVDVDTLFFIFYYQQGTYRQFLAARELKWQSWRFHTRYQTWFQRLHEPRQITSEYELGSYLYFDWESTWAQRQKDDFRFEYRYLESEPAACYEWTYMCSEEPGLMSIVEVVAMA